MPARVRVEIQYYEIQIAAMEDQKILIVPVASAAADHQTVVSTIAIAGGSGDYSTLRGAPLFPSIDGDERRES